MVNSIPSHAERHGANLGPGQYNPNPRAIRGLEVNEPTRPNANFKSTSRRDFLTQKDMQAMDMGPGKYAPDSWLSEPTVRCPAAPSQPPRN